MCNLLLLILQGPKGQKNESVISNLRFVSIYLSFLRHTLTIDRNLVLIESLKSKLPSLIEGKTSSRGKATRPEDLIKMYDATVQSFMEIGQLSGLEDDASLKEEVEAQLVGYKAFR